MLSLAADARFAEKPASGRSGDGWGWAIRAPAEFNLLRGTGNVPRDQRGATQDRGFLRGVQRAAE